MRALAYMFLLFLSVYAVVWWVVQPGDARAQAEALPAVERIADVGGNVSVFRVCDLATRKVLYVAVSRPLTVEVGGLTGRMDGAVSVSLGVTEGLPGYCW